MYDNRKTETYSLYECVHQEYLLVNVSKHRLVKYLVNTLDGTPWYARPDRPTDFLLEQLDRSINMNGNDSHMGVTFGMEVIHPLRPYVVLDNYDRIVDIRTWDIPKIYQESLKLVKRSRMWNVNSNHKRCYGRYRSPHIHQTVKQYSDPELAPYMRAKKKFPVATLFWERYTQPSKSWKDQTKCRKQWEKNLK